MPNPVRHFAIQAEDVERARRFYERVFGWRLTAWGPPEFYLIHTGDDPDDRHQGALQRRAEPLDGTGMRGFECTIDVQDLDAIRMAIVAHGGTLLSEPFTIQAVGRLCFFADCEGNRAGVMQYVPGYA